MSKRTLKIGFCDLVEESEFADPKHHKSIRIAKFYSVVLFVGTDHIKHTHNQH